MLTGVGVDLSKFFGAGVESESQKCDSAHLWCLGNLLKQNYHRTKLSYSFYLYLGFPEVRSGPLIGKKTN